MPFPSPSVILFRVSETSFPFYTASVNCHLKNSLYLHVFGDHIDTNIKHEKEILLGLTGFAAIFLIFRFARRKRGKEQEKLHDQGLGL